MKPKRNMMMAAVALAAMLTASFSANAANLKDFARDLDSYLNTPPTPEEHELYVARSYADYEAGYLKSRLGLSDDQTARVRDILKDANHEARAHRDEFPLTFRAAEDRLNDTESRIDALLGPGQRHRFDEFKYEWGQRAVRDQMTHRLRDQLGLSEAQTRKVRGIVRYTQHERDRIRGQYASEGERADALHDLRRHAEDSIRDILSPDQQTHYAELLEHSRERRQAFLEKWHGF